MRQTVVISSDERCDLVKNVSRLRFWLRRKKPSGNYAQAETEELNH